MLSEIVQELASAAVGRLRLTVTPGLSVVLTDREKLRRILVNLMENALKYAPDGFVDVHAEQANGQLILSVSDGALAFRPGTANGSSSALCNSTSHRRAGRGAPDLVFIYAENSPGFSMAG